MEPLVIPVIFVAMFIQALSGFGSALIAMPFLIALLGTDPARASFVLLGQTAGMLFMYEYRKDWQFPDVWMMITGTLIGIPAGIWVANAMQGETFMLVLGIIIIVYSVYALSGFKLKKLSRPWSILFGFFSGVLHSAYNVGGPPLVMYNGTQDWQARRFKGNTQFAFFVMGWFVIFEHIRSGNIDSTVIQNYLLMLPAMILALFLGFRFEKYVNQNLFRKLVMILLLIVGIRLLF